MAANGHVVIVTSAITLTEVIKLKNRTRIPQADATKVSDFFKNDFIRVRNVDREIAELARNLIWKHTSLNPKDAIHVATAMRHKIKILDTFDKRLIKLSEKLGNPPIRIGRPDIPYQNNLFVAAGEQGKSEDEQTEEEAPRS